MQSAHINSPVQAVLFSLLFQRALVLSHFPWVAVHPGQRCMFGNPQITWLDYYGSCFQLCRTEICTCCAQSSPKNRWWHKMNLLSSSKLHDFVAIDIDGPLPKTVQNNQYIHVIASHYSSLTRVALTSKTAATRAASLFFDHWRIYYDISTHFLTNSKTKFVSTLSVTVYTLLTAKQFTSLA